MYFAECKTVYGAKFWKSELKVCRDNFVKHSMGFAKSIGEEGAISIKACHFRYEDE